MMSNNLVLQRLSVPGTQFSQLEAISNRTDSLVPPMQGEVGLVRDNPSVSHPPMPDHDTGSKASGLKRKDLMETSSGTSLPSSSMPNKRVVSVDHRPWLQQQSGPNRKILSGQNPQQTPGSRTLSAQSKKVMQLESVSPKSTMYRSLSGKNQTSPKVQDESFESVRSKMRESLASALALAFDKEVGPPNMMKNHQDNASNLSGSRDEAKTAMPNSISTDYCQASEERQEISSPGKGPHGQKNAAGQMVSEEAFSMESNGGMSMATMPNGQEFQSGNVLTVEDVPFSDNFYVKDELLQGNGLSWVYDSDMEIGLHKDIQNIETQKSLQEEVAGKMEAVKMSSPEDLAVKIEAELFKLFGGVNKKYKEKGRSLLFNLKDRNNPELRERVVSGDIPPEKLCSMTAEELASKELSQWRMAKAEELAKTVVLHEPEVDVRRLVKKTHKGEFQVEVEQDDSLSVEVSVGAGSINRYQSGTDERESHPHESDELKVKEGSGGEKSERQEQDAQYTVTIPSGEQDSEVDFMVDDAMKDLPPIVSLDEFMESLDSEPPFENLHVDGRKSEPVHKKEEMAVKMDSVDRSPKEGPDLSPDMPARGGETSSNMHGKGELRDGSGKSEDKPSVLAYKGDHIWQGSLQLNISSIVSGVGIFKSGEKTSANEWSDFLDIKGRVKLDAFEKFLQDLRMSRSRAIMVLQFLCKYTSPESEHTALREVADLYVTDERVGFAEPCQGVEIYFCPHHGRTRGILGKILSEEQIYALNAVDNGLIGVVVWRKTHLSSTISPNLASNHKHGSKKNTSRRHQENDDNVYSPISRQVPTSLHHPDVRPPQPSTDDDDDADVPPGFGPGAGASRQDDDLPEFNFLGPNSSMNASRDMAMSPIRGQSQPPPRPVEEIRQLIHKYGQPSVSAQPSNWRENRGMGVPVQPWDDDDDIPEWQPQVLEHNFRQPVPQPVINRHQPMYPTPPPLARPPMHYQRTPSFTNSAQPPAPWPIPPPGNGGFHGVVRGRQPGWHQDASRSRGR